MREVTAVTETKEKKLDKKGQRKRNTEKKKSLLRLIGAKGPSESPNDESRTQVCRLLWERPGNGDNSIPFRFPYFFSKDKTQHAGNTQNMLY